MDPAIMQTLTIYTMPTMPARWDAVGIFYVTFCVFWSLLIITGATILIVNRNNPIIKIRAIPFSLTAVAMLHAYWILAQIVYPIGMTMDIVLAYDIQYFFMGIWFPLGIALFHAANIRFLYVAKMQKMFTQSGSYRKRGCNGAATSWLCRLRNLDPAARITVYIGFGMILQVLLSVGMWLACRKYHPTYGIPGTEIIGDNLPQQIIELGRGWEWWPTVLWQVIWNWVVAPILLSRAWGIRDTLGWRTQTIGCCLSGLHAAPMFLIASYVPAFNYLNQFFPPSQWFHIATMFLECFTIFLPACQVLRHRRLIKKTLEHNSKWETSSQTTTLAPSDGAGRASLAGAEKGQSIDILDQDLGDRLYTMGALEHVLNDNPFPLLEFSALRDFSGENIAFLIRVAEWKASCPENMSQRQTREAFSRALGIYADFISPRDAEFPVNISSSSLKEQEDMFEAAARVMFGLARSNSATPFDMDAGYGSSDGGFDSACSSPMEQGFKLGNGPDPSPRYNGEIPSGFNGQVFDAVQKHVKYLVLTNTWPKFVNESQRRQSVESERSDLSGSSGATLTSRMNHLVRSFV